MVFEPRPYEIKLCTYSRRESFLFALDMSNKIVKNYPNITHISKDDLDTNDSLIKMLAMVGQGKRVIDFGCATGYFAKLLSQQGCEVTGVEINPEAAKVAEQYCNRVIIADLDNADLRSIVEDDVFDVVTFGDVLEHLKDPWAFLTSIKDILTPDGYIVASVPNVAHGSVRLALAEGRFEYAELGLLDSTHIRFFTYDSLHHLFESTGYAIELEDRVFFPIFNDSPLTPDLVQERFPRELLELIGRDKHSESLQFVVRAYPWSMAYEHGSLKKERDQLQEEVAKMEAELRKIQLTLQQTQTELQQTQTELQQRKQTIQAMEGSRVWRAKRAWMKTKKTLMFFAADK